MRKSTPLLRSSTGLLKVLGYYYGALVGLGPTTISERRSVRMVFFVGAAVGALMVGSSWLLLLLGILVGGLGTVLTTALMATAAYVTTALIQGRALQRASAVRILLRNAKIERTEGAGNDITLHFSYTGHEATMLDADARETGPRFDSLPLPNPMRVPVPLEEMDELGAGLVQLVAETGEVELYGVFNSDRTGLAVEGMRARFPSWTTE